MKKTLEALKKYLLGGHINIEAARPETFKRIDKAITQYDSLCDALTKLRDTLREAVNEQS